jgi:hypothetical protein
MTVLPFEPYGAKRTGWTATTTSKDAERRRALMQKPLYHYVAAQGAHGATRAEACREFNNDGGAISSALTVMHKAGVLARLTEVRDGCKVYVDAAHVNGRATEQPTTNKPKVCPHCGEAL